MRSFFARLTLRWRLSLALLASVVVAVAAGTAAHLIESRERLEADLRAHGQRVLTALRSDLGATATALDEELASAADPRQGLARLVSSSRTDTRFTGAQGRLVSGRLEVLKMLTTDGVIITSGHWPASFGALDPLVTVYTAKASRAPVIVDEATPQGSAPALERWASLRVAGREVIVVAGRFLDEQALETLRARTGADLLELCPKAKVEVAAPCVTAQAETLASVQRLWMDGVDVGDHTLYVGLDRSGIERVRKGIIVRALIVGVLSIVFAVVLGTWVARRVVRPIEGLATAAQNIARGDLTARVPDSGSAGEVQTLVEAFNVMAKDLETEKRRLVQAERVAAWQEIARGLAHELKNPLTPILSAMDVIRRARQLDRKDFDDILEEQATAVVEEVMRLKELADAFARFARLPEKKPEPLQLDELVDHVLALYAGDVVVDRDVPDDGVMIVADRTQLMTALTNLIKNAVEAMEYVENKRLAVRLSKEKGADKEPDTVVIIIDDAGPGIADEIRERLFTPYVTTKGSRGTGLGLALSHRIVVEHNGTIEASTSPLGGARFMLRLPQPIDDSVQDSNTTASTAT